MTEDRDKLVLGAAGSFCLVALGHHFPIQPGVLEGQSAAAREVFSHDPVRGAETVVAERRDQCQHAHEAVVEPQRKSHGAIAAQLAQ